MTGIAGGLYEKNILGKLLAIPKGDMVGGAANFGMGILAIGTHLQEEQGEMMNVDEAYNMFMEYTHYRTDGVYIPAARQYHGLLR